jgi:hypothetical protein
LRINFLNFFRSAIGTTSEVIRKPSGSDSETTAKPGISTLHKDRNGLDRSANSSTSDRYSWSKRMEKNQSTGEVAELFGTQTWRVARIYELGLIPEPPRIAGRRVIPIDHLAEIALQLRSRGWLNKTSEAPPV